MRNLIALLVLVSTGASAATYYLSPDGRNTDSGLSESESWGTFSHALAQLAPGDTLVLADGRYDGQTSGWFNADCSNGIKSGTASQPIVVKAQNERRAWLAGDGSSAAVHIQGCAFWRIEGLRVSGADAPNPSTWYPVLVDSSSHIELYRLLVTNNNRFVNSHLVDIFKSEAILIEESEFYWFSRAAVSFSFVDGGVLRRSYANSRQYENIDGGFECCNPTRGDVGYLIWDSASHIQIANSVSEGQELGIEISSGRGISDVSILGSISIDEGTGARVESVDPSDAGPTTVTFENFVVAFPKEEGIRFNAADVGRCTNCSIIGDEAWSGNGINIAQTDGGLIPWPGNYIDTTQMDPALGGCLAFIPDNSPLKRTAPDGGDIGANVLYRYQDKVATCEPLWNSQSGAFPCGAVVSGVNDLPGSSCLDVHERLHVGSAECALPASYAVCGQFDGGDRQVTYTLGCDCNAASAPLLLVGMAIALTASRSARRNRKHSCMSL